MRISDDLRRLLDRIDREMVELPKDCHGEAIHVGDTVRMDDGRNADVVKLCRVRYSWHVGCKFSDGTINEFFTSKVKVINKPHDSLERIADDLEDWGDDNRVNWSSDVFDRAAEFAHRIRKLTEREDK